MGNQRGLVRRIERKLEHSVGDAFARVFGGSIVPEEVEALLRREASDGMQTLPGDLFLAPNDYVITVGPTDFRKISADRELTAEAFSRHLGGYIQEQGWQTYGEVVLRFEESEGLHTGQFRARAVVNPDADPRQTDNPTATTETTHANTAEPGVPAMTDNQYRGGQSQGRPGDEYYDDQYSRPQEDPRAAAPEPPRAPYPPDQGYPPNYEQGYPPRQGYPEQGATPNRATPRDTARDTIPARLRPATAPPDTTRVIGSPRRLPGTAVSRPTARRPATGHPHPITVASNRVPLTPTSPVTRSPDTAPLTAGPSTANRTTAATSRAAIRRRRRRPRLRTTTMASRTTASSPRLDTVPTHHRPIRASTPPPDPRSRCNSMMAVAEPTSCARART